MASTTPPFRRLASIALLTLAIPGLSGCIESASFDDDNVRLVNNSNIYIEIERVTSPDEEPIVYWRLSAKGSERFTRLESDECLTGFQIVDRTGKVLRRLGEVCGATEIVYP